MRFITNKGEPYIATNKKVHRELLRMLLEKSRAVGVKEKNTHIEM